MRPSTTKLSTMLVEFGAATAPFTARAVKQRNAPMAEGFRLEDETNGKNSRLYIWCPSEVVRRRLEWHLQGEGVTTVKTTYYPGHGVVSVGVTYFKGRQWDE